MRASESRYDIVVLAGGTGRRLGGADKAAIEVGGVTLLDRVLGVVGEPETTVVVGPQRPTVVPVQWCREDPPGGGPAAGIVSALPLLGSPVVVVLAVDLPLLSAYAVAALLAAMTGDGVVAVDADGRRQVLLAAYRTDALRAGAERLGDPTGAPVRRLLDGLVLTELPLGETVTDCDTPEDLARVRAVLTTPTRSH